MQLLVEFFINILDCRYSIFTQDLDEDLPYHVDSYDNVLRRVFGGYGWQFTHFSLELNEVFAELGWCIQLNLLDVAA